MSLFKEKKKKVYKKKNTRANNYDSKHNNQLEYYTTWKKTFHQSKMN